ncbi:Ubiquitin-fold modifier-conjugating enzyme 1 [Pseudolycoriella hygida]|uniref:Ubiquitin-fold modifier-conjugating enzyme 1 n=1 Tax=Pseudolycoriella hygida TaxID=35572 RepID=A0A9Q0N459_9DIPT|nr:Ubiquitin-fold modifier-conjugating enzyme 1 [Pseudolycoriella hygida]
MKKSLIKLTEMVDESTRTTLSNIPLLKTRAGPRDKELWVQRLKEEYQAMIKVTKPIIAKATDILIFFFFFVF